MPYFSLRYSTSVWSLAFAFCLIISFSAAAAKGPVLEFKHSHPSVFARETTGVTFLARIDPGGLAENEEIVLVELNEQGEFQRFLGAFSDEGITGDRASGDGVYSRKIQVYEKKADRKYYSWIVYNTAKPENAQTLPRRFPGDRLLTIEVLHRPSFVDMLKQAFGRLGKSASD